MKVSCEWLPSLPSPSASPYHVAVAGRHSMSMPAAFADFPAPNSNAEATGGGDAGSSSMQSRTRAREREEAMEGRDGGLFFPSGEMRLLALGVAVAFFFWGTLFYGFEKSRAPMGSQGTEELALAR